MAVKQASRLIVPGRSGLPAFGPPVVDDFNRANASNLGASWGSVATGGSFERGDIVSNQYATDSIVGVGADYYTGGGSALAFDAAISVPTWTAGGQAIIEAVTATGVGVGTDTFNGFAMIPRMLDAANLFIDIYHSVTNAGMGGYAYVASASIPSTAVAGISMGIRVFNAANTPYEMYLNYGTGWVLIYSGSLTITLTAMYPAIRMDFGTSVNSRFDDFRYLNHAARPSAAVPSSPFGRKARERLAKPRVIGLNGTVFGILGTAAGGATAWDPGVIADSANIGDSLTPVMAYVIGLGDSANIGDAVTPQSAVQLTQNDSANIADVLTPQSGAQLTQGDSANIGDVATPVSGFNLTQPDAANIGDSATPIETYALTQGDSANIGDVASPLAAYATTLGDSANISDTPVIQSGKSAQIDDLANISDSQALVNAYVRALGDNANITDALSTLSAYFLLQGDSATITDAVQRAWAALLTVSDGAQVSDTATPSWGATAAPADAANITDQAIPLNVFQRTQGDSANISDALAFAIAKAQDDVATISDLAVSLSTVLLTQGDAANIADSVSTSGSGALSVSISDAANISDSGGAPTQIANTLLFSTTIYSAIGTASNAHDPGAGVTPKAIVVQVAQHAGGNDQISGITYGGVPMTELRVDIQTAGTVDPVVYTYVLTSGIPSGSQTVAVTTTGTNQKYGRVRSFDASGPISVDSDAGAVGTLGAPSLNLATTPGRATRVVAAMCSQADTPVGVGTGVITFDNSHDYGNEIALFGSGDGEGDGSTAVGFDAANADAQGWALSAVALGSDGIQLVQALQRIQADATNITDSQNMARSLGLSDLANISDLIALPYRVNLSDSANIGDAVTPVQTLSTVIADATTVADATTQTLVLAKAVADQATITDFIDPRLDSILSISDALTAADTIISGLSGGVYPDITLLVMDLAVTTLRLADETVTRLLVDERPALRLEIEDEHVLGAETENEPTTNLDLGDTT